MGNKKYKYLFQLMYTSIILIIVPILLFYNIVWKSSFKEISKLNAEYYNHSLEIFSSNLSEAIYEFREQAVDFSLDSRYSSGETGVFYEGTARMKKYGYHLWEATNELKLYAQKTGFRQMGIYYYSMDWVLTDNSCYDVGSYIRNTLRVEAAPPDLMRFFSEESFEQNKIILSSIFDQEGKSETLLVGVHTILGKNKERALVFCQLDSTDTGLFYLREQDKVREKYYVVDNATQKIIFSVGASQEDYSLLQSAFLEQFTGRTEQCFQVEMEDRSYFAVRNAGMNLTFVSDNSGDGIQRKVDDFYHSMKFFFFYILLATSLTYVIVIYFNYKPVHRLLGKVTYDGMHEFEAILNIWEGQKDIMTEQRMVILDLLMKQLLFGVPISQKHIEKLGVSNKVTCFCVFVIEQYILKVTEVEAITEMVEETYQTLLFVTDLTEENATVVIAFMEHDCAKEIQSWLEQWGEEHLTDANQIKTGHVVSEINEIQKSFADCRGFPSVTAESGRAGEISELTSVLRDIRRRSATNERLKEKVLDYLDEHFTDSDLSQQKLADHLEISVYTLSKLFNNQVGVRFSEYINVKRIEYAMELLKTTEMPVKKIAFMTGIVDENYFSKIFKKYVGCSPVMYRDGNR